MDKDKIEIFKEAYKRGILPDDKKVVFEELVNRGLIQLDEQIETPQSQEIIQEEVAQPTTPRQREISPAESAFVGTGQGATFGYGDEIISGLATPVAYAGIQAADMLGFDTGGQASKSIVDIYKQIQGESQEQINEAQRQNPKSFLGGEIISSILGGTAAARGAIKTGKAAKDFAKRQITKRTPAKLSKAAQQISSSRLGQAARDNALNILSNRGVRAAGNVLSNRWTKAAGIGGATGAAYGYGTSDIGEGLQGAKEGLKSGIVGGVVGQGIGDLAVKTGGKLIPNKIKKLKNYVINSDKKLAEVANKKLGDVTSSEIRTLSDEGYEVANKVGGELNPNFVNKLINKVKKIDDIDKTATKLSGLERTSANLIKRFEKTLKPKPKKGAKALTLKTLAQYDSDLGDIMYSPKGWNADTRSLTAEGKKVLNIQRTIRDTVENATPEDMVGSDAGFKAYKNARKLWSRLIKFNQIEKIEENALSAKDVAGSLKQSFRTLLNNDKKLLGFTEQEKKRMKKIADTGIITNLSMIFGNRMIGGGAGFMAGGPAGLGTGLAMTTAARKYAASRQKGQVKKLKREITKDIRQSQRSARPVSGLAIGQAPYTSDSQQ